MDEIEKRLPAAHDGDASVNNNDNNEEDDEEVADDDEQRAEWNRVQRNLRLRERLRQHGMGGNHHHHQQGNNQNRNDDPFAKVKFTIPSFSGAYDADAYLDWEMTMKQKFNSHL